jgi:hypothetical protein
MRRLAPLAIGLAVAAAVAGAAFAVQALALRRATPGDVVAARAVGHMTRWRVTTAVEHVPGQAPLRTICAHARYRFPGLPGRRWTALVLGGGFRLAEVRGHVRSLAPLEPAQADEAGTIYALAGCPHFFARRLVQAFARNHRFVLREATFLGRAAYALPFRVGDGTVELYVTRDGAEPFGARLRSPSATGWSTLVVHRGATAIRLRKDLLRRLARR